MFLEKYNLGLYHNQEKISIINAFEHKLIILAQVFFNCELSNQEKKYNILEYAYILGYKQLINFLSLKHKKIFSLNSKYLFNILLHKDQALFNSACKEIEKNNQNIAEIKNHSGDLLLDAVTKAENKQDKYILLSILLQKGISPFNLIGSITHHRGFIKNNKLTLGGENQTYCWLETCEKTQDIALILNYLTVYNKNVIDKKILTKMLKTNTLAFIDKRFTSEKDFVELCKILLKYGADINVRINEVTEKYETFFFTMLKLNIKKMLCQMFGR